MPKVSKLIRFVYIYLIYLPSTLVNWSPTIDNNRIYLVVACLLAPRQATRLIVAMVVLWRLQSSA